MKSIFLQTAEHHLAAGACTECLNDLPDFIRKHTDWNYLCVQTDTGCVLKPVFRNMPYCNSFVPEIDVVVSRDDTRTVLHLQGQPVKAVRVFMAFWFSFLLVMEVFIVILAITSNLDSLFPLFIPLAMCAFGYLLCKLATKATFNSVVKAIKKEFY